MTMCYVCGEREAIIRLTVRPTCRCFYCCADDPDLPPDHVYKQHIEPAVAGADQFGHNSD